MWGAGQLFFQAGGVRAVFLTMQRLVGKAEVQVMGTEMLQKITSQEPAVRERKDAFPPCIVMLIEKVHSEDSTVHRETMESNMHLPERQSG